MLTLYRAHSHIIQPYEQFGNSTYPQPVCGPWGESRVPGGNSFTGITCKLHMRGATVETWTLTPEAWNNNANHNATHKVGIYKLNHLWQVCHKWKYKDRTRFEHTHKQNVKICRLISVCWYSNNLCITRPQWFCSLSEDAQSITATHITKITSIN